MIVVQGELVFADDFFETFEWSLLDYPVLFAAQEFDIREREVEFELDLDGRQLRYSVLSEQDRLILDAPVEGWDRVNLSVWLDKEIRQTDIPTTQMLRWIQDALSYLVTQRGLRVEGLWRAKYVLARKLTEKVTEARDAARKKGFSDICSLPTRLSRSRRRMGFASTRTCSRMCESSLRVDGISFENIFSARTAFPFSAANSTEKSRSARSAWIACLRRTIGFAMSPSIETRSTCRGQPGSSIPISSRSLWMAAFSLWSTRARATPTVLRQRKSAPSASGGSRAGEAFFSWSKRNAMG